MDSQDPYDEMLRSTVEALSYADELDYSIPNTDLDFPEIDNREGRTSSQKALTLIFIHGDRT